MRRIKVLAFVMAGGEGARLHPLTADRSKPAVPFGGRYRIVDFVLSNLVNSGIYAIYLLVQYKSQSLIEHIRKLPGCCRPCSPSSSSPSCRRRCATARTGSRAPPTPCTRTST